MSDSAPSTDRSGPAARQGGGVGIAAQTPGPRAARFAEREGWLPSPESTALVGRGAEALIARFRDPDHFRRYFHDHRIRLSFDLDYTMRFIAPGAQILEVGALPYFLTLALIEKGYAVTALDKISGEYVPEIPAEYGIRSLHCDLDAEPIPAGDGTFDTVIMNEVFEHLRINLIFSMREVLRVLKPGGRLLLSTPNLRSLYGLYNLLFRGEAHCVLGGIYQNYSSLETRNAMGHVREYTPKELVDFLEQVGFHVDGVIYRGDYSGPLLWRMAHYFTRIRPEWKPFFSIVASKL